ncbi:acyltransferase family protein [Thermomonas aquatica]|uniref:DUF1624 domain-containing protein n=1 Tax=Thermomonas aquatica TaxID=2202149 RepID=A0A5B7ZRH2_9GAMM|nr:heparan-alpha-glucosaminide N-acetyltransferase domain-containing protein [Thermomonas aquatica]QDA57568.1 DUF1624 domain-containing protein [Thermomonas aquatica]
MSAARAPRFASVDALRGWAVAAMLLVNYPGDWSHVYAPLRHSQWNGCTPTDLVFPLFLFLVGVSTALAMHGLADDPALRRQALAKAWLRASRLALLGLALHALAMWAYDKPHFRPWGVLQRIGLCFGAAASAQLYLRPRGQWLAIAVLLLGYWALLATTGGTLPLDNVVSRVDAWMLGPRVYEFDAASGRGHDPEGLLSTLPAIASTLLGMRAGMLLRERDGRGLLPAGLAALAIGAAWALLLPWNKNLWTPSYAVWSAGWASLLLAACHALFDRRGWRPFGRSMGINAIVAYAGSWAMACVLERSGLFAAAYRGLLQPLLAPICGDEAASLAFAICFVGFWWVLAWGMARRGWRVVI